MKAAWYERQGPAEEVIEIGEMVDPEPGPGEVRIRIAASGVNPGDVKKRQDRFGIGMPFPRVIPHSDGAGDIESVGDGVDSSRVGERVWCFGAQSYRPYGTAAEFCVVPAEQAVQLPENVSFEQGACLGIPGITAYRSVFVAGPVKGKKVLVQGGGGAVGQCAIALAKQAGAKVFATVRSADDERIAKNAGADRTIRTELAGKTGLVESLGTESVDHIVEVAFDANIDMDQALLKQGASVASYASGEGDPVIPFWPLVFKNIGIFFLGSDDFTPESKAEAANGLNELLKSGWDGFKIEKTFALEQTAAAHSAIENKRVRARAVIVL